MFKIENASKNHKESHTLEVHSFYIIEFVNRDIVLLKEAFVSKFYFLHLVLNFLVSGDISFNQYF